ncbi:MAG: helix-turn-helix domain-containing protein [Anaerolineae bacterium]|nr:helix-turn-helix domain-containing protein [Anaerolineae bacterium]
MNVCSLPWLLGRGCTLSWRWKWITTAEAAELAGYTPSYIRKAIGRGLLHVQKLGRNWFLKKAAVLAYAKKMEQLGPRKHSPWRTKGRQKGDLGGQCAG